MRKNNIFSDETNTNETNILTVGPLSLNESSKLAITAFNDEIQLSADEFDALYILAAHAGRPLAPSAAAEDAFGGVLEKINAAGNGFMWIERSPESGYIFRTSWGSDWSDGRGSGDAKHEKVQRRIFVSRLSAAAAAVLVVVAVSLAVGHNGEPDEVYFILEPSQVPAASFQSEYDDIEYEEDEYDEEHGTQD